MAAPTAVEKNYARLASAGSDLTPQARIVRAVELSSDDDIAA